MIINCRSCNKEFERSKKYINRNIRRNYANLCSSECVGNFQSANQIDEYSMFNYHIRSSRRRCQKNGKEFALTKEIVKLQWDKQNGICPYTNLPLENPIGKRALSAAEYHPLRASLDRIDSSIGYIPSNIEFVCLWVQSAKSLWSKKDFIKYCKLVANNSEGGKYVG